MEPECRVPDCDLKAQPRRRGLCETHYKDKEIRGKYGMAIRPGGRPHKPKGDGPPEPKETKESGVIEISSGCVLIEVPASQLTDEVIKYLFMSGARRILSRED